MAIHQAGGVEAFLQPLHVDVARLPLLAIELSKVYTHLAKHSTDQFLATPISVLPSGHETGKFLAIDLGGTNLRVAMIELLGPHRASGATALDNIRLSNEKIWPIGEHLKMDHAEDLFSWIGDCIAEVVDDYVNDADEDHDLPPGQTIPIGITFSFPMIQSSIAEATLMPMGKGFAITSNLDLAKLLLAGYARHTRDYDPTNGTTKRCNGHVGINRRKSRIKGLPPIEIAAITNDTVATLASLAYSANSHPPDRVAMGLIVGTGTNATIPMKLKNLHESKSSSVVIVTDTGSDEQSVVVNTEWTINGTAPPLRELGYMTTWDVELDKHCEAPGFQPFEYMTAGRYLGELVRLILFDYLSRILNVSPESLPVALRKRNEISTTFLATVVARSQSPVELSQKLESHFPVPGPEWKWTTNVATVFIEVADLVKTRSAALTAAATVGLLTCTGELTPNTNGTHHSKINGEYEKLIVAYEGGTIVYYPGFLDECQSFINDIVRMTTDRRKDVILRETKDGGIIGAAVLAGTVWHPRS